MNSNNSSYFNLILASFNFSKLGGLWTIFRAVFLFKKSYLSNKYLGILSSISLPCFNKTLFIYPLNVFWFRPLVVWYTGSIFSVLDNAPNLISLAFIIFFFWSNLPNTIILVPISNWGFKKALLKIETPTGPCGVANLKLSLFKPPLNLTINGILSTLPSITILSSSDTSLDYFFLIHHI